MERIFARVDLVRDGELVLSGDKAHYLTRVLRLAVGATLRAFDGERFEYEATLVSADKRTATLALSGPVREEPPAPLAITLAQGLPKSGKMDGIVQKATELGVARIVPFYSRFGDVRPKREADGRVERWERIAEEACRQCGRIALPRIESPLTFEALCERMRVGLTLFAYERPEALPLNRILTAAAPADVLLVIGPEGGFSEQEAEQAQTCGAQAVGLGPRVLRTETAGPALLAALQAVWGDWDRTRCAP
jgi:16S rRNA (uracil1498-N3)-methyltransferase